MIEPDVPQSFRICHSLSSNWTSRRIHTRATHTVDHVTNRHVVSRRFDIGDVSRAEIQTMDKVITIVRKMARERERERERNGERRPTQHRRYLGIPCNNNPPRSMKSGPQFFVYLFNYNCYNKLKVSFCLTQKLNEIKSNLAPKHLKPYRGHP